MGTKGLKVQIADPLSSEVQFCFWFATFLQSLAIIKHLTSRNFQAAVLEQTGAKLCRNVAL